MYSIPLPHDPLDLLSRERFETVESQASTTRPRRIFVDIRQGTEFKTPTDDEREDVRCPEQRCPRWKTSELQRNAQYARAILFALHCVCVCVLTGGRCVVHPLRSCARVMDAEIASDGNASEPHTVSNCETVEQWDG